LISVDLELVAFLYYYNVVTKTWNIDVSVRYRIMYQCWNDDAHERPSFEQLVATLSEVIASGRPGAQNSSGLYQNIQTQPSPLQMQDLAENVDGKSLTGLAIAAGGTPESLGAQNVNSTTMATTV
jgi:hypothetical protein